MIEDIMMAQVHFSEEQLGEMTASGYDTTKTVRVTRTVSQLMKSKGDMAEEPKKILEAHGIKPVGEQGMFLHPETVVKGLLWKTQWKGMNIRDMLLRVAGSEPKQLRLGGSPLRGVMLPWAVMGL